MFTNFGYDFLFTVNLGDPCENSCAFWKYFQLQLIKSLPKLTLPYKIPCSYPAGTSLT